MRILVCVKRVPAPGAKIVLTPDGQDIDASLLGFAISPHEECAVEEAVQIVEREGGSVTVMTLGPPEAAEQLRAAVAVGATSVVLLPTDIPDWDPVSTSAALVSAISRLEDEEAPFDLILFGNESADSGGYQVGIRVARSLGRPMVTGIKGIDTEGDSVAARRETPSGWEVYRLPLPAMVGVKEGINLPRYPTLKGRMAARRAPVATMDPAASTSGQSKVMLMTPPDAGSAVEILGEGPEAAPAIVDIMEGLGLV
ncbi:MAG: electron transfer flavoprotein subunit beta/FixA family protein [Acidimicrobiia bacterium]|nr:electron transfer flavoprotein subunit beta/FixA family protein [Acidimicrobiia bacterium]MYC85385.1 electron transfer flavoprotein subunit beta/FixA family protein [Acidimicrobiia bacterium]